MFEEYRKIIHIDMDAFYASVEIRDNPSLRGKPVIVGGMPGTRGVVCTASYEARKFGVHSAMSSDVAARLCPQGIFIRPRGEVYEAVSARLHRIFHDYTDLVEPLSLDEAYLDVTTNKRGIPYATGTAREIRRRIWSETGGLTASAGVSFNKFLAKMASEVNKPNGMAVITPDMAEDFLEKLPVEKFYGIGPATADAMHKQKIFTGLDLRKKSKLELAGTFGTASGCFYYDIARGIDPREVTAGRERKSLGTEVTFERDVTDLVFMGDVLKNQAEEVSAELKKKNLCGRTVVLKVKYFDFQTITRSRTLPEYIHDAETIRKNAFDLLTKTEAATRKVRLLGVTVSGFPEEIRSGSMIQLEFPFIATLKKTRREF